MSQDPNFPRPRAGPGIHAVQVNNAREMVAMHVKGRNPARQTTSATLHSRIGRPTQEVSIESLVVEVSRANGMTEVSSKSEQQTETQFISNKTTVNTTGQSFEATATSAFIPPSVCVPARNSGPCTNPQCTLCGQVVIPLPVARFPFRERPSISVGEWSIFTQKGSILLLDELDRLAERYAFPLPEMIFGHNHVRVVHDTSGASVEFNTLDALDALDPDSEMKVSYHHEWLSTRPRAAENLENPSVESVRPYDWTYTTKYRGTIVGGAFEPTEEKIPLDKLKRPEPILFYDEAILYEDELGDNGILVYLTKIRVMPTCLLLLCRFFLRVDNVAVRIRDTRLYVDFESGHVLREHRVQEAAYDEVFARAGRTSDPKKLLRDSNWVAQNLPVMSCDTERFVEDPNVAANVEGANVEGANTPQSGAAQTPPVS